MKEGAAKHTTDNNSLGIDKLTFTCGYCRSYATPYYSLIIIIF